MFRTTQRTQAPIQDIEDLVKEPLICSNPADSAQCGLSERVNSRDTVLCLGLRNNYRVFVFSNVPQNELLKIGNIQTIIASKIMSVIVHKTVACVRVISMSALSTMRPLGENDIVVGDPNLFGTEVLSDQVANTIRRFDKTLFILYSASADCVVNCRDSILRMGEEGRVYVYEKPPMVAQIREGMRSYQHYLDETSRRRVLHYENDLPGLVPPIPQPEEAPRAAALVRHSSIFTAPQPAEQHAEEHGSEKRKCWVSCQML